MNYNLKLSYFNSCPPFLGCCCTLREEGRGAAHSKVRRFTVHNGQTDVVEIFRLLALLVFFGWLERRAKSNSLK